MAIVKVFRNGQMVRLPEGLRVGGRLEPGQSVVWPESFWRAFGGVTEDFARPPQVRQEREALDG